MVASRDVGAEVAVRVTAAPHRRSAEASAASGRAPAAERRRLPMPPTRLDLDLALGTHEGRHQLANCLGSVDRRKTCSVGASSTRACYRTRLPS